MHTKFLADDGDSAALASLVARELAAWVASLAILPAQIEVAANGPSVVVVDRASRDGYTFPADGILQDHSDPGDGVATVCQAFLSGFADFVTETLREPWPAERGAEARSEQSAGSVLAGYAVGGSWLAECAPLHLVVEPSS